MLADDAYVIHTTSSIMKLPTFFAQTAILASLAFVSPFAYADQISGSATGLVAPTSTITFDEHVLAQDTLVTNQYADKGVTFNPGLYFTPTDPDVGYYGPVIAGHYLGNYRTGEDPASVAAITILFSTLQTRAAFGLASNDSGFTFSAMLGNAVVDSFTAADVSFGFYGFSNELFDRIVITSLGPGYDDNFPNSIDSFDFDNLQYDLAGGPGGSTSGINPGQVPEPELGALFGVGLFGAIVMRRRAARKAE